MLTTTPTLDRLYNSFADSSDRPEAVVIPEDDIPEPYHKLLVHTHHMTVTVEKFFSSPVDVSVLDRRHEGDDYARKILLTLRGEGRVVQFGLVHINLGVCPKLVREQIVAGQTPLGRVLIQNEMLRRIEPVSFLRVELSETMAEWFGTAVGTVTYGRIGVIFTGDRPAVEVLEILAPLPVEQ